MDLKYSEGIASIQAIYSHLMQCNETFTPFLSERVDIQEYSIKIFERAVTFEAWSADTLVGLVAAYFNDSDAQTGYITSVSTLRSYMGKGIASKLINMSIEYARRSAFKRICLEAAQENSIAIRTYKECGFREVKCDNGVMIMTLDIATEE